jgi:hypothetical protein
MCRRMAARAERFRRDDRHAKGDLRVFARPADGELYAAVVDELVRDALAPVGRPPGDRPELESLVLRGSAEVQVGLGRRPSSTARRKFKFRARLRARQGHGHVYGGVIPLRDTRRPTKCRCAGTDASAGKAPGCSLHQWIPRLRKVPDGPTMGRGFFPSRASLTRQGKTRLPIASLVDSSGEDTSSHREPRRLVRGRHVFPSRASLTRQGKTRLPIASLVDSSGEDTSSYRESR